MTRRASAPIAAAVLSVVSAVAVAAGAQRGPGVRPIVLTPMDYIEIRQLVNRSAFALDTGGNNGYDYADLFVDNGESARPSAKGREQLAALARGGRLGPENTARYLMNHLIEPTADGAIGKEDLVELNWDAPAPGGARGGGPANGWDLIGRKAGNLGEAGGRYKDVYVKTPTGWRFRRRDFVPSQGSADPAPPPGMPPAGAQASSGASPATADFIAPTQQSSLTGLDYLEIAQLVSSYGHALDSGYGKGENGESYANLYTRDAAFAGAVGHDQLVTLAQIQPRGPRYVRHFLTNHVIEPMPGGAKGKEYLAVIDIGEHGKASSLFLGGHYEDTYVKTSDGWRINTRRLVTPRSGPRPPAQTATAVPPAPTPASGGKNALTMSPADYIAIQQLIAGSAHADEVAGHAPARVRDFTTNYIVHPSAQGATARVYVVRIDVGGNGNAGVIRGGGHYDDVYVKAGEGWRIRKRTFVPSTLGARDVYAPK